MSISNNYVPVKELGNGVTVVFSGAWAVLSSAYIRVYLENVTTGVQTLKTLDSDYTLTFDDSGFEVDFTISGAPTSDNYVVISRDVAQDQTVPYKTSKGFQGAVQEGSFDKITAMVQDTTDSIGRSIVLPIGSVASTILPSPTALNLFGWNSDATAIVNYTLSDFPSSAEIVTTGLSNGDIITWDASNNYWVNTSLTLGTSSSLDAMTAGQYAAATSNAVLTADKVWADSEVVELTDGATIAIDLSTGINFEVTLEDDNEFGNPTNPKVGQRGSVTVIQDDTGTRVPTFASNWKNTDDLEFSTDPDAVDVMYYDVNASDRIIVTGLIKDVG